MMYFLGSFPPEYGGVTIKNQNLYIALQKKVNIKKVDFNLVKRRNIKELFRLGRVLLGRENQFVIGVAGKRTRKRFTQLLYSINRNAMGKSIIFLMGGTAAKDIAEDSEYQEWMSSYKTIYVETQGMLDSLEGAGVQNGAIYPNARFKPKEPLVCTENTKHQLKCVFFSQVSKEKGVDIVIQAARSLPNIQFVFYGNIEKNYAIEFMQEITHLPNVQYKGIFKEKGNGTYEELAKYDVMLLPTRWKAEGVPGIIVEAKIAGLAEIVSNQNFNAELVHNGVEGIVLSDTCADKLAEAIQSIDSNRICLAKLKAGSKDSAERYYIENYIDEIVESLSK